MSDTAGANAAATLSLEINTASALANLKALNAEYMSLHANMSKKLDTNIGKEIGQSVKGLQSSLVAVSSGILSINKALDDIVAAGGRKFNPLSSSAKQAASEMEALAAATSKNSLAAQAANNASIAKLLRERAEAAAMAAEAEKRLAQATAANISAAQAANNASTAKLLRERAEAAAMAAEAEKRLAQATAANVSAAQAANNASTAKLLRERAEAAAMAAEAEKRLAQATAANTAAAKAANAENTRRLLEQRASVSAAGSITTYDSLMNTVVRTVPTVNALNSAQQNLASSTNQSATAQVHWNKVANEGHAAARGLAGGLGALWLTYGSVIPLLAGAAVGAALKSVVTTGKELEYQFTYIKAIADGAVVSFNEFKQAMSGSLFDPTKAASGLRILTQAGLSAADAMKSLPEVLKLAAVGEVELGKAAKSATAIMHTFSLTVNDMSHIGDVFATAARLSATSVGEMMDAMKQASSLANIFGVTMEETAAALATLANRGIEGSAAGTAIRNMVKELSSPATEKAAYAMQQYGIQIFNADGSTKKFTENLKQLSEVTSVMTDETKARFLEDLFNERGAKAANILLSDMEKMNRILKEIEMSSKGLGFMTEAQIQISQSTEGIAKQLVASTKLVYAEVFASIKPQIDDILTSIGTLVKSSGFKEFMNSLASAVANFTVFLKDHASTIGTVIAAYAAFKVVGGIGVVVSTLATKFVALQEAMIAVEVASKAATGATIASGTAMAGTSALIGKLGLLLSGTLVVGLAAAGAAWLAITLKTREYDSTLVALTKATEDSVVSQKRLNDALEAGLSAVVKSNDLQAERIRLLREGKSAADAAAGAMDNLGYASAKSAETQAVSALRVAKEKLNSEEFKGQDINFNPSPAFVEAFDNVQKLTKAAKDSQIELERAASNSVRAGMEGRRKEAQDIAEKAFAEVEVQNKKFKAIAERGKLAKLELEEGKFYGSQEVQDARKATLKKDIERAEAAARFSPIDSKTAESDSTKVELARREAFLSENSLAYERKPKSDKKGSFNSETRDIVNGYGLRQRAQTQEFENYKKILDQRVKYGALSQEAENVLLEAARDAIDGKSQALANSEKGQLQSLLVDKETNETAKESIRRRIQEIDSVNALAASKRDHAVVMREELAELKKSASERKLQQDTSEFVEKEERNRQRAETAFALLKTHTAESRAAVEAYLATMDRGEAKLQEYAKEVRDTAAALEQLRVEFAKLGPLNETQVEALDAQSQAAARAAQNYDSLKQSIEEQAEANAQSTLAIKAQEEGINRLNSAIQAADAVMSAMLNARTYSGYYTTLESMRAEGNINKEKIAQLAQLKAAYEAMGQAGVAAAAQVEAQMISLSAHLDPIADQVRHIFEDAFTDFFDSMLEVIEGTKSLKDALKSLGNALKKELWSMASKELSQQFMKLLGGGLEPGKGSGLFSWISQLFVPDSREVGKDIVSRGREIFNSVAGGGRTVSGSFKDTLSNLPNIPVEAAPDALSGLGRLNEEISSTVQSLSNLGASSSSIGTAFSSLGSSVVSTDASITMLGASSASSEASIYAMSAASTAAESSILGTEASSILADVALASTATAATAASAGLSSVAASSSAASVSESVDGVLDNVIDIFSAKGNVFSGSPSLHQYANTVQSTPKTFAFQNLHGFAKGGVFAEAGPEAVMPLARDNMGRLGVRAQTGGGDGGNVFNITVNVNGNANAQDVRRSAGQGTREALAAFNTARRYA